MSAFTNVEDAVAREVEQLLEAGLLAAHDHTAATTAGAGAESATGSASAAS